MRGRRRFLGDLGLMAAGAAFPLIACSTKGSAPDRVYLIRHGEEPDKGESPDLNGTGRRRADALIKLFPARFPAPQYLFAARPSKHSSRAVETIEPLSKALKVPINDSFEERDYRGLADLVLSHTDYAGSRILVCWLHDSLSDLASAFGVSNPPKWSSKTYDKIWDIRFAGGVTLHEESQSLLPGDR